MIWLAAAAAVALILLADSMRRTTIRARRRLHVATIRADRATEDGCWLYLRDQAYRDAIAITLSRHDAVTVQDLAPLLERARELAAADWSERIAKAPVAPTLEVVR